MLNRNTKLHENYMKTTSKSAALEENIFSVLGSVASRLSPVQSVQPVHSALQNAWDYQIIASTRLLINYSLFLRISF